MAKKGYILEVDIEASSQELDAAIKKMEQMVTLKGQLSGGVLNIPDSDVKKIVETKTKIDGLTDSIKKQKVVISDIEKAQIRLKKAQSDEAKQIAILNLETNKQNKANREAARDADKSTGAYEKLSQSLIKNKKAVKDLMASKRELTAEDKKLIHETQELDKQLKKIDRDLGDGHRTVGLYADGIKEAIAETRIFDSETSKILVSLRNLKKEWDENTEGENKFSNALKLIGVGLAIAAIGALVKIANAGVEASQALSDASEKLSIRFGSKGLEQAAAASAASIAGYNTNISEARRISIEFVDTLTKSKKALLDLSLQNKELAVEEDVQRQISEDTTIGLQERIKALLEAQRIETERLENNKQQAIINNDLAQKELAIQENLVGKGQAKLEFYEKQKEATNELKEADKELAHQVAINAREQRQLFQEQIANNIEITRSKRLTANSQATQLQNQLKDEKIQLEQRKVIAKELQDVNLKAIDSEAKELEKAGVSRKLFDELVAQGDEVAIKNIIRKKLANIEGTIIENELIKVIKQAQENEIRNGEALKKLQEEEIKRKQKIADLEKEIGIIRQETQIKLAEDQAQQSEELNSELNTKILEQERALNIRLLRLRRNAASDSKKDQLNIFVERGRLLELQKQKDLQAVEDSVNDEKIKAEEKLKIEEKYQADRQALILESQQKQREIDKAELEEKKKIEQKQVEIVATQLDKITEKINEQLDKRSQLEQDRIDKQESANDDALQRQIKRAEEGKKNDVETYALKQAQLERAKSEQQKKDERREKILSYYNLLSSYAKEDAETALPRAARDIAISEAISAAFAEKGGIAGEVGDRAYVSNNTLSKTHGSGRDVITVLDKDEGILTRGQMANLGKDGFYSLQKLLENPINDDIMHPQVPVFTGINPILSGRVEQKLDQLITITKNKPVPNVRMDTVGNAITENVEGAVRHIKKVISKKPGWRRG